MAKILKNINFTKFQTFELNIFLVLKIARVFSRFESKNSFLNLKENWNYFDARKMKYLILKKYLFAVQNFLFTEK